MAAYLVRERVEDPTWAQYAGSLLFGTKPDRVVAELPTIEEATALACRLNLESGGARAAWNNSKQHLNDFLIVYTTEKRFEHIRRFYVERSKPS